jgi:hypothetical protein
MFLEPKQIDLDRKFTMFDPLQTVFGLKSPIRILYKIVWD